MEKIDTLDLSRVKHKLLREGWMPNEVSAAEAAYRRFLKQAAVKPTVPDMQVDKFWHAHILDTERYAKDCEAVFGRMLHHDPFGDAAYCASN